jgi:hypothetical protein
MVVGFIGHLQNVITNNYDSLTDLHTSKITVNTAHIKSPQPSLSVTWQRLSTAEAPLPLGSGTFPGLGYQLLTSHQVKVKDTLQLAVYDPSVLLDVKPLETHDQRFFIFHLIL